MYAKFAFVEIVRKAVAAVLQNKYARKSQKSNISMYHRTFNYSIMIK